MYISVPLSRPHAETVIAKHHTTLNAQIQVGSRYTTCKHFQAKLSTGFKREARAGTLEFYYGYDIWHSAPAGVVELFLQMKKS